MSALNLVVEHDKNTGASTILLTNAQNAEDLQTANFIKDISAQTFSSSISSIVPGSGKVVQSLLLTEDFKSYLNQERSKFGNQDFRDEFVSLFQTGGGWAASYAGGKIGVLFGAKAGLAASMATGIPYFPAIGGIAGGIYGAFKGRDWYDTYITGNMYTPNEITADFARDIYDDFDSTLNSFLNDDSVQSFSSYKTTSNKNGYLRIKGDEIFFEGDYLSTSTLSDADIRKFVDNYSKFNGGKKNVSLVTKDKTNNVIKEQEGFSHDSKTILEEIGGSIDLTGFRKLSSSSTDFEYSLVNKTTTTQIKGISYLAHEVVGSVVSAGEAVATFINEQISDGMDWLSNGGVGSIQVDIANWLAANMQDIVNGNLTAEEAFIDLAEYIGQQRITGFIAGQISTYTGAEAVISQAINEMGYSGYMSDIHAGSVYEALTRMAVEFSLNSEGWDGDQYTKAVNDNFKINIRRVA